jgi:CRISPR-associated protein Csm3
MRKVNHYVICGQIELVSGTRIGGSDDMLQIGGTDLTCIKDPASGRPYIPGSSIKGKMRSSLEKALNKTNGREPCGCARQDCPVCRIFGPHKNTNHTLGPTRIIVRDAPVVGDWTLENKTESINRRDTGAAEHPRTVERVATGAKFKFEIGVQEFDVDSTFTYTDPDEKSVRGADALLEAVYHCIDLVEQTGIGAGTGKGYGQVKIEIEREDKIGRRSRRPVDGPAPNGERQP